MTTRTRSRRSSRLRSLGDSTRKLKRSRKAGRIQGGATSDPRKDCQASRAAPGARCCQTEQALRRSAQPLQRSPRAGTSRCPSRCVPLVNSLDIISAKVQIDSNRTSRKAFEFSILTLIGTPSRLRPGEQHLRGRTSWSLQSNIARWLCSTIAGPVCADHLNPVRSTFAWKKNSSHLRIMKNACMGCLPWSGQVIRSSSAPVI
jgi:hypothetical protein